nr:hypothetical protein [Amycolatopsis granulosa]
MVLAGYLSVPFAERPSLPSDWLPGRFISVSECLTGVQHGPEFWAWHTDRDSAARFEGRLLAIGLTIADATALAGELRPQFAGMAERAAAECLVLRQTFEPMPHDAQPRGFEIVGVESGLMSVHSWLCHGYDRDAAVRLNRWGLLDSHARAAAVLAWILGLPPKEAPITAHWTVAVIAELPR